MRSIELTPDAAQADIRYGHAANAATDITGMLPAGRPDAVLYGKILFRILDAVYAAEKELQLTLEPSTK